jgi:very-short-patch-repair endonuclease
MSRVLVPAFDRSFYAEHYEKLEKSPYQISKETNGRIKPLKILADLRYYGFKIRSRKEAQKLSFKNGYNKSPTAGKPLPEDVKEKIGKTISKNYSEQSEEYKKHRTELCKAAYESKTPEQKEEFREKSFKALKEASINGSRLEKFLASHLGKFYIVETQKERLIENEDLRVDLYLPQLRLCIETDGVFHFENVLEDDPDKYARRLQRDKEKNGLLLQNKYKLIRVQYRRKMSNARMSIVLDRLVEIIEKIKSKELTDELIYMKIED